MADITKQLSDIYGAWHIPWWERTSFKLAMAAIIVSLIIFCCGYVIWRIVQKRRQIPPLPWDEAIVAINMLSSRSFEDYERIKQAYIDIIGILKRYIKRRYGADVEGKTDDEIFEILARDKIIPSELFEIVADVVRSSGAVRFAGANSAREQCVKHIQKMRNFVEATIPRNNANT